MSSSNFNKLSLSSSSSSDSDSEFSLFKEPDEFYKPKEKAKFVELPIYETKKEFKIRLIGEHPLWAHHVWNASIIISQLLQNKIPSPNKFLIETENEKKKYFESILPKDKIVLELGAGAAIPSIVVILAPSARTVKYVQDFTDLPSIKMVQAPQLDVSHPIWVPVISKFSLIK